MNLYLCVDDTDDLTKETSTGKIAAMILKRLEKLGGAPRHGVSRHQLLLQEGVPYTSHNSAMCIQMSCGGLSIAEIRREAERIVLQNCAKTANPGLAICCAEEPDRELIAFGFEAKRTILEKTRALALAETLAGVTLLELGGDGAGVIGALAGIGLRMSGCDGSFRGKKGVELRGKTLPCRDMCAALRADQILDSRGKPLPPETPTAVSEFAKLFLRGGMVSALAVPDTAGVFQIASREEGQRWGDGAGAGCDRFTYDNDENECTGTALRDCCNCLYRRWTADGYRCMQAG